MTTKYSLLTQLTWTSFASFTSEIKSRVSNSSFDKSTVITLCWGASRFVLTYSSGPWLVILHFFKSSGHDRGERERFSHAVVGHIFIDDFSPVNSRLDPALIRLRKPHKIFLVVWAVTWMSCNKYIYIDALPLRYPCTDTRRDICRPRTYPFRISTPGFPCLDERWYLPLYISLDQLRES